VTSNRDRRRFIVISGLSGAGKSVVLNALEDLEFSCIDNLPVSLLAQLMQQLQDPGSSLPAHIAVGIDARNPAGDLRRLPDDLAAMRQQGILNEVVFVEASDEVLTRRFSETRRRHPLSADGVSLEDAIARERRALSAVSELADLHIDTSFTAVHELRDLVRERVAMRPDGALSLQFISFGYKHGTPRDADFVFDVRCLPNPHWDKELRKFSGRDRPVVDFMEAQPEAMKMAGDLEAFLDYWVPRFEAENRSYLCVAIGCTGGHHRSVYLVERLGAHFRSDDRHIIVKHRDL
jgi:UPF0042 nucleotide-binding protein